MAERRTLHVLDVTAFPFLAHHFWKVTLRRHDNGIKGRKEKKRIQRVFFNAHKGEDGRDLLGDNESRTHTSTALNSPQFFCSLEHP